MLHSIHQWPNNIIITPSHNTNSRKYLFTTGRVRALTCLLVSNTRQYKRTFKGKEISKYLRCD